MKRNVTNKINRFLDEYVPPVLRDSKWLMSILFRIVLGKKYTYYMEFKSAVPKLSEQEINGYYTLLADTFIKRDTDLNDKSVERILQEITAGSVLDAAAGRGYLADKVKKGGKAGNVTALDIVLPKEEERNPQIQYVEGTLTNLPFADNSFDIVLCTHALEHIKDVEKAINELRRVCKNKLIVVVPRQREYLYTFDLHINFYPYKHDVSKIFGNREVEIELLGNDWFCIEKQN